MKRPLFYLLALVLLLSACATAPKKENLLVLLPGAEGGVGAIEFKNKQGAAQLSEGNKAISVADRNSLPAHKVMSEKEMQALFGEALAARPTPANHFILYFQFDSPKLTPESTALLQEVLAAIKERDSREIVVVGHTDRVGTEEYNRTLAQQRAKLVTEILVGKGVNPEAIQTTSHGEGNPLIPTPDEVAEPRNRRVEVTIR